MATDTFLGRNIKPGSVDVSLAIELKSTALADVTGVAHTSVTASYWREGGVRTAITTSALGSVNAAHSDGGWIQVDATNQPGLYRLDVPDAAFAEDADWVVVSVKATGAQTVHQWYSLGDMLAASVPASYDTGTLGAVIGSMTAGSVRVVAPVTDTLDIQIVEGDDYLDSIDRALEWTDDSEEWPDLTGATVVLRIIYLNPDEGAAASTAATLGTTTVVTPTGTKLVRTEITAAQSAALESNGTYSYHLQATTSASKVVTLAQGTLTVTGDI